MPMDEKQLAIFRKYQSMMIDAIKSHTGLADQPVGKKRARENEAILWSVNAMFLFAAKKQALGVPEWDEDISELRAALAREGLDLPTVDPDKGRDRFLDWAYYALRRRLQGGMPEGVLQFRKDEAILWAAGRLSRLAEEVRDLEEAQAI